MPNISKLTKNQLIDFIQEREETKFDQFKVEFGLPYNTDEEWIDFIKGLRANNQETDDLRRVVKQYTTRAPN